MDRREEGLGGVREGRLLPLPALLLGGIGKHWEVKWGRGGGAPLCHPRQGQEGS